MPIQAISEMVTIRGKVAMDIKENRPTLTSSLMVFLAGVIYGLATFYFKSGELIGEQNNYYLVFTILFGFLYMVASQIGVTLLLWAMSKILKGSSRLMTLFSAVGYSFLPYGIFVAIITNLNSFAFYKFFMLIIALGSFAWWVYNLARIIHLMEDFTFRKALLSVLFFLIFLGSFIYVFGY